MSSKQPKTGRDAEWDAVGRELHQRDGPTATVVLVLDSLLRHPGTPRLPNDLAAGKHVPDVELCNRELVARFVEDDALG